MNKYPLVDVENDGLMKTSFNLTQLQTLLRLQGEANDVMSDAWRSSFNDTIPYYRAGLVETVEILMHIGFKWWKNEHPTEESLKGAIEQSKLEVVDVLHFALSDLEREGKLEQPFTKGFIKYPEIEYIGVFAMLDRNDNPLSYDLLTIQDICEQAVYKMLKSGTCSLAHVLLLAECFDMDANELYNLYVAKNVLNKFRTAHGQREGTYHKIWNGREDNEWLTQYVGSTCGKCCTPESIYAHLEDLYASMRADTLTTFA